MWQLSGQQGQYYNLGAKYLQHKCYIKIRRAKEENFPTKVQESNFKISIFYFYVALNCA